MSLGPQQPLNEINQAGWELWLLREIVLQVYAPSLPLALQLAVAWLPLESLPGAYLSET